MPDGPDDTRWPWTYHYCVDLFDSPTADDPGRWLRRACASGPHVREYTPGRFSALLATAPACRPLLEGEFDTVELLGACGRVGGRPGSRPRQDQWTSRMDRIPADQRALE